MLSLYFVLLDDSADKPLFEEFYKKYNKLVYHIAGDRLNSHELREDCVQEVFLNFAKNFRNIKEILYDNSIEGLIRIVTINTAIDIYRKNKRHIINTADNDIEEYCVVSEECFDVCDKMLLKEAIDSLPEDIKHIFYLKYVFGYNGADISKLLGISESLVRKRCMIGRQLVQKYIEGD